MRSGTRTTVGAWLHDRCPRRPHRRGSPLLSGEERRCRARRATPADRKNNGDDCGLIGRDPEGLLALERHWKGRAGTSSDRGRNSRAPVPAELVSLSQIHSGNTLALWGARTSRHQILPGAGSPGSSLSLWGARASGARTRSLSGEHGPSGDYLLTAV